MKKNREITEKIKRVERGVRKGGRNTDNGPNNKRRKKKLESTSVTFSGEGGKRKKEGEICEKRETSLWLAETNVGLSSQFVPSRDFSRVSLAFHFVAKGLAEVASSRNGSSPGLVFLAHKRVGILLFFFTR